MMNGSLLEKVFKTFPTPQLLWRNKVTTQCYFLFHLLIKSSLKML